MLDIIQKWAGQLDEVSTVPEPQPVGNDYPPFPAALLQADTRISILQCRDPSLERRADICEWHDVQFGTPLLCRALPYLQSRAAAAVGRINVVAASGCFPGPSGFQCDVAAADLVMEPGSAAIC